MMILVTPKDNPHASLLYCLLHGQEAIGQEDYQKAMQVGVIPTSWAWVTRIDEEDHAGKMCYVCEVQHKRFLESGRLE